MDTEHQPIRSVYGNMWRMWSAFPVRAFTLKVYTFCPCPAPIVCTRDSQFYCAISIQSAAELGTILSQSQNQYLEPWL